MHRRIQDPLRESLLKVKKKKRGKTNASPTSRKIAGLARISYFCYGVQNLVALRLTALGKLYLI